jgi:type VII secretion-associated serine protease mycosin
MTRWLITILMAGLTITLQNPQSADQVSEGQWYHKFLDTVEAQQISRGEGVTVAVLDTGVDANHPDLAGSVLPGADFTGVQGDGRSDANGHGTGMASLIAAHGRVQGIAPQAKILPVRVIPDLTGKPARLADAIKWATRPAVKVISLSISSTDDLLARQDIQAAIAADIVVVAAAGNRPTESTVQFPASVPGVLAVGGVDQSGNQSTMSVSGPQIAIAAPGEKISSASPGGAYRLASGTSGATAIVAGAVALVRAKFPQMKAPEVIRRLTATAIDKGAPGRDPEYGFGVLNIVGALTAELPAATSAPAVKPSSAVAAPPGEPSRFPWWVLLIAAPVLAAAVIIIVLLTRRREG